MQPSMNTVEILKLLDKSNCGDCNEKTCLAFAAAVFSGKKNLKDCPRLDKKSIICFDGKIQRRKTAEDDREEIVRNLKQRVRTADLCAAAERTGGSFANDQLTIKVFGKNFAIGSDGSLKSDIHVNPWITIPLLSYALNCSGAPLSGKWVPFRELKSGKEWQGLFHRQCEKRLKSVADEYTELFEDLIRIFNGKKVENHYESDISLILHPFPKIPILICYWLPEEGLESDLNLFFDSTAEENSGIEAIYALGTGIVRMFEKIALRHGLSINGKSRTATA